MGDILTKVFIAFEKKNKENVLKLLKHFNTHEAIFDDECIKFDSWTQFNDEDFKDLKLFCVAIECWEYEDLGSSVIWNSEDDTQDELKILIKTKELEEIKE